MIVEQWGYWISEVEKSLKNVGKCQKGLGWEKIIPYWNPLCGPETPGLAFIEEKKLIRSRGTTERPIQILDKKRADRTHTSSH